MNKYKRIYEEKAEGELELVGLIKEGETIKVIKDLTPQQKAIINNKLIERKDKSKCEIFNNMLG